MTESTWHHVCILCAPRMAARLRRELQREATPDEVRARLPRLEAGHCCMSCAQRIRDDLSDIVRLAAHGAASGILGRRATGLASGSTGATFGSKPPIDLAAIDPELTTMLEDPDDPTTRTTVLELLESWEILLRDERGMTEYGPVSEARAIAAGTLSTGRTLTEVVRFLRSQVEYATTEPTFSLDLFAVHIHRCATTLARYDLDAPARGSRYRVACPTTTDQGECGAPLLLTLGATVHCRHCNRDWEPVTLLHIAGQDADIWLDAEAISHHLGIPERTIRHWGQHGKVARRGQLYRLSDITRRAHQHA